MGYTEPIYTQRVTVIDGRVSATFDVEILAAIEEENGWPRVTERVPALRITTHTSYDDSNPIIIRKRDYHVDDVVTFHADYADPLRWGRDFRHYGSRGFRNANGATVERLTATREQLERLAVLARDQFVADVPTWATDSVKRLLASKANRADVKAEELRREALALTEKADKLRAELGAL